MRKMERASDIALQGALALLWYVAIVVILRIAGKRFAGPVTAFDLVVLITLGVVLVAKRMFGGSKKVAAAHS